VAAHTGGQRADGRRAAAVADTEARGLAEGIRRPCGGARGRSGDMARQRTMSSAGGRRATMATADVEAPGLADVQHACGTRKGSGVQRRAGGWRAVVAADGQHDGLRTTVEREQQVGG
jgi:hypothetical protein